MLSGRGRRLPPHHRLRAWRWTIVSRGLGVRPPCRPPWPATTAVFLNVTLPGGVGATSTAGSATVATERCGRGLRAVAWERFAGQFVQAVLTVAVLLVLPSPVRSSMPLVAIAVTVAVFAVLLVARARPGAGRSAWARVRSAVSGDLRDGLLARRAWLGIVLASALVVCGHAVTFLIAARAAGITAPTSQMLPLALLVMLAMVLPSVGGWGPREGAAAWAFGAAGLGAGTRRRHRGCLRHHGARRQPARCRPLLVVSWFRRIQSPEQAEPPPPEQAAHA